MFFATDFDLTIQLGAENHDLVERFRAFIRDPAFCCVGAKSALGRGRLHVSLARDIRSTWDDLGLYPELLSFIRRYRRDPALFQSFAVIFEAPCDLTEAGFEAVMWERLQSLSDKDSWYGNTPDRRMSEDPLDANFALSFGGEGCFVVGLHPRASRPARRFERAALVFNLHDQFTRLRQAGMYEKLRETILDRDLAQSGSINPMLARHGSVSEARQYSGRAVDGDWVCPFQRSARSRRDAA